MSAAIDSDRLLEVEDVAELLRMSVGSIYHLVSESRVPCVKLSARCLRFRSKDLNEWLEQQSVESRKK